MIEVCTPKWGKEPICTPSTPNGVHVGYKSVTHPGLFLILHISDLCQLLSDIQHTYLSRFPKRYHMSRFCSFSNLTFDDLSRPQMTSDPKNLNRFISSLVSAFQKYTVYKKSKISLFRSIFKYELCGLKWPETKIHPSRASNNCLTIPHHPSYLNPHTSYLNPHTSYLIPHTSYFIPRFLFSWVRTSLNALLIENLTNQIIVFANFVYYFSFVFSITNNKYKKYKI